MTARRFPPPWSVEEQAACYVVRNCSGQKLSYVYYVEEPGTTFGGQDAQEDEARRIAANFVNLPELLNRN